MDLSGFNEVDPKLCQPGVKIWIPNPYPDGSEAYRHAFFPEDISTRPIWVPAEVVRAEVDDLNTILTVRTDASLTPQREARIPASEVSLMNDSSAPDNLTDLANLSQASLVYALGVRYTRYSFFTRAGGQLVMLNPIIHPIDDEGISLYDSIYMDFYRRGIPDNILDTMPAAKREKLRLPPHIFEQADKAYRDLRTSLVSQSLIMTGESGAGKSEAAKHALHYLARVPMMDRVTRSRNVNYSRHGPDAPYAVDVAVRESSSRDGPLGWCRNPFDATNLELVEQRILASQTVLDAFTCCALPRNRNATRAHRITKIFFDEQGRTAGGSVFAFGLARAPLHGHVGEDGRAYHVFYQLLAGAPSAMREQLYLGDNSKDYRYLTRCGSTHRWQGMSVVRRDADEFGNLRAALGTLGLTGDAQVSVFRVLSAILFIGQIGFGPAQRTAMDEPAPAAVSDAPEQAEIVSTMELELAAELLGIPGVTLRQALTINTSARMESLGDGKPMTVAEAEQARDAMAYSLYSRLVQWLVIAINTSLRDAAGEAYARAMETVAFDQKEPLSVAVCDFAGFHADSPMPGGSFDWLLDNFISERLQDFFNVNVFKLEQRLYETERIKFNGITFHDNTGIIDLLEKRSTGILALTNEACMREEGRTNNDSVLVGKMHSIQRRNKYFEKPASGALARSHFSIRHTNAPVEYSGDRFMSENKQDTMGSACLDLIGRCSVPIVEQILVLGALGTAPAMKHPSGDKPDGTGGAFSPRPQHGATPTGAALFRISQLKEAWAKATTMMKSTHIFYVHCQLPNETGRAAFVDHDVLADQVRAVGLSDALMLRHKGFSDKLPYEEFYDRFIIIAARRGELPYPVPPGANLRELCRGLVEQVIEHPVFDDVDVSASLQFGTTKIFMRKQMHDSIEALREVRLQSMDKLTVRFQALFRGHRLRKRLGAMMQGLRRAQATWRTQQMRNQWYRYNYSARVIQGTVRTWQKAMWYRSVVIATVRLQAWWRRQQRRLLWARLRRGIRLFHVLSRGFVVRKHVEAMVGSVTKLQRFCRAFLGRNRIFWQKVRAALLMQACWRGFKYRIENEDVMQYLTIKRFERARKRAATLFQSQWRGLLVWRRFQQMRSSAIQVQRWGRTVISRRNFLLVKWAVRAMQAAVRGMLGRLFVRDLQTLVDLAEEAWRLKIVRERESFDIANAHLVSTILEESGIQQASSSHIETHPVFKPVDLDVTVDNTDVYPDGWMATLVKFVVHLRRRGVQPAAIEAGTAHTMLLTDEGQVYSWGWGDRGQLGHAQWRGQKQPRLIEGLMYAQPRSSAAAGADDVMDDWMTSQPSRLAFHQATAALANDLPIPLKIRQIACGDEHSVALADNGRVYTWGFGRRGQLGQGSNHAYSVPTQVSELTRGVAEIAAGSTFTVAMTTAGSVYVWGSGKHLGLGVFTGSGDQMSPQPVKALIKHRARKISAGRQHTVVVTHAGDVFSWGSNKHGQLGVGDKRDRLLPVCVSRMHSYGKHARAVAVSTGARHTAIISSTGRLYTWGRGQDGQLGTGDKSDAVHPVWVRALEQRRVVYVACASRCTYAVTDFNELLAWGCVGAQKAVSGEVLDIAMRGDNGVRPRRRKPTSLVDAQGEVKAAMKSSDHSTREVWLLPREVPLHDVPGRHLKGLRLACSHTLDFVGIKFLQMPVSETILLESSGPEARARRPEFQPSLAPNTATQPGGPFASPRLGVQPADQPSNTPETSPQHTPQAPSTPSWAIGTASSSAKARAPLPLSAGGDKASPAAKSLSFYASPKAGSASGSPRSKRGWTPNARMTADERALLLQMTPQQLRSVPVPKLRAFVASLNTNESAEVLAQLPERVVHQMRERSFVSNFSSSPNGTGSGRQGATSYPGPTPIPGAAPVANIHGYVSQTVASPRSAAAHRKAAASSPSTSTSATKGQAANGSPASATAPTASPDDPLKSKLRDQSRMRSEMLSFQSSSIPFSPVTGCARSPQSTSRAQRREAKRMAQITKAPVVAETDEDILPSQLAAKARSVQSSVASENRKREVMRRHIQEQEKRERQKWREDREKKGRAAGKFDALGYFTSAHLVAASNDDMTVSDVKTMYGASTPDLRNGVDNDTPKRQLAGAASVASSNPLEAGRSPPARFASADRYAPSIPPPPPQRTSPPVPRGPATPQNTSRSPGAVDANLELYGGEPLSHSAMSGYEQRGLTVRDLLHARRLPGGENSWGGSSTLSAEQLNRSKHVSPGTMQRAREQGTAQPRAAPPSAASAGMSTPTPSTAGRAAGGRARSVLLGSAAQRRPDQEAPSPEDIAAFQRQLQQQQQRRQQALS